MNEPARVSEAFRERYPHETAPQEGFCPYGVTPIGAHVDHQFGLVTGMPIDKGIHFTYAPTDDGSFEVTSLNFEGTKRFAWGAIPPVQHDWADHLRGAAWVLERAFPENRPRRGLRAVMAGSLPSGGLSSSATVILGFMDALCRVNAIVLTDGERIRLAQAVENDYVGVRCGILDQSCEVLGRREKLLYLDTLDGSYRLLDRPEDAPPYDVLAVFSGMERSLASSPYNTVVDNMQTAAHALKQMAGLPCTTAAEARLREVPEEAYRRYADRLTEGQRRCAAHFFEECQRVRDGAAAWERGDMAAFGRLMSASRESVVQNLGIGAPEMIALCDVLEQTDGVYGACFSGAGFRGFCLALADPAHREDIRRTVAERYRTACPHVADKYSMTVCHTPDGIGG